MSCEQVHEGVRPRGSQTISALIDTAAAPSLMVAVVAAVAAAARGPLLSTSSCSLDCFCFQVTSYLLLGGGGGGGAGGRSGGGEGKPPQRHGTKETQ